MSRPAESETPRQSLRARLALKGREIRQKHGPDIGLEKLRQIFEDRAFVPYPCEIRFDGGPLLPGEFAHSSAKGFEPAEGFAIFIHPRFAAQSDLLPYIVLHQLVLVTGGGLAGAEDAETFGAAVLGVSQEEFYRVLCEISSQVGGDELV